MHRNIFSINFHALRSGAINCDAMKQLYWSIEDISHHYPGFAAWYFSTVIPGVLVGTREIAVARIGGKIAGIAIIKDTQEEKKICTVKVVNEFIDRGIGVDLFKWSLETLKTDSPLISVSTEHRARYSRIFDYFGFELEEILNGYYRPENDEYVYNGSLLTPGHKPLSTASSSASSRRIRPTSPSSQAPQEFST